MLFVKIVGDHKPLPLLDMHTRSQVDTGEWGG